LTPKGRASKKRSRRQRQPAATRQAAYTKINRADKEERSQNEGCVGHRQATFTLTRCEDNDRARRQRQSAQTKTIRTDKFTPTSREDKDWPRRHRQEAQIKTSCASQNRPRRQRQTAQAKTSKHKHIGRVDTGRPR
jgi:hypothetical protein